MKNLRYFYLLLILSSLLSTESFAQTDYGPRIRYNDVKHMYSLDNYNKESNLDYRYIPSGAVMLNILLTGSGHLYIGERIGFLYMGMSFAGIYMAITGTIMSIDFSGAPVDPFYTNLFFAGAILWLGTKIYTIFSVSKRAKIKNMAYASRINKVSIMPVIDYKLTSIDKSNATYGVKLVYAF